MSTHENIILHVTQPCKSYYIVCFITLHMPPDYANLNYKLHAHRYTCTSFIRLFWLFKIQSARARHDWAEAQCYPLFHSWKKTFWSQIGTFAYFYYSNAVFNETQMYYMKYMIFHRTTICKTNKQTFIILCLPFPLRPLK